MIATILGISSGPNAEEENWSLTLIQYGIAAYSTIPKMNAIKPEVRFFLSVTCFMDISS
jgi:hypothetical protein